MAVPRFMYYRDKTDVFVFGLFPLTIRNALSRVIPLGAHFASGEAFVFVVVDRVIPATELVEYFAAEAALEFVKAVHRMRRVAVGRNSEHIVFAALVSFGRPVEQLGCCKRREAP